MRSGDSVGDIDIIHHLGIIGRDLGKLAGTFEALGFTLTPLSEPKIPRAPGMTPEEIGAGNRCAVFKTNYLELLGVIDARKWSMVSTAIRGPFDLDLPLSRYEGLHVLHLGCDDIDKSHSRLWKEKFAPLEIRPFSRDVETLEGKRTMRAKSFAFPPGTAPEVLLQVAQHETPELIFQDRYQHHPNGAVELVAVTLCADDAKAVADRYARIVGAPARQVGRGYEVDMQHSRIEIVSRKRVTEITRRQDAPVGDFLAGMTVAADLVQTAAYLRSAKITHAQGSDGLKLDETVAGGAFIEFVQV